LDISMERNMTDHMGDNATLNRCKADAQVTELYFRGKLGPIINLYQGHMRYFINKNVNNLVCDNLRELVHTNVTLLVRALAQQINSYNSEKPDEIPSLPLQHNILDLRNHSLTEVADYVVNELIGTEGVMSINVIMDHLTTNSGHLLINDIPQYVYDNLLLNVSEPKFSVALSNYGNIEIGLNSIELDGLDTWDTFKLLVPVAPQTLFSHTQTRKLVISVGFNIKVEVLDENKNSMQLNEYGMIKLDLSNMTLINYLFGIR